MPHMQALELTSRRREVGKRRGETFPYLSYIFSSTNNEIKATKNKRAVGKAAQWGRGLAHDLHSRHSIQVEKLDAVLLICDPSTLQVK